MKVVERVGQKLQDMLCKSDPWESSDCKRDNCRTCESSYVDEKLEFKSCYKRSIFTRLGVRHALRIIR